MTREKNMKNVADKQHKLTSKESASVRVSNQRKSASKEFASIRVFIDSVKKEYFESIFLDGVMPSMNGWSKDL